MSRPVNPLDALPDRWRPLAERSVELLRGDQDPGGAWPASPGFAPYVYSWFRDGSFIADGASATGLYDEADRFHGWCARVMERERSAVVRVVTMLGEGQQPADSDYLPARYNLDGTRHEDDWWNFQVDGYGTWLWALERHLARTSAGSASPYAEGIETAVRYLVATGTRTCRDWWEENRDQTHVTTLAGVAGGLRAAIGMGTLPSGLADEALGVAERCVSLIRTDGVRDGHLVKWLGGTDIDASLLAVAAVYDVLPIDDPLVTATVGAIEARLVTDGVHRYAADTFYGGGQWPVLAALLARHHTRAGHPGRAAELLDWIVSTADSDLLLPEQVSPLLAPGVLDEWLERWGPSAHPLLWSHGAFLAGLGAIAD
ncbi:MAG: glycoside hydrolase family 15 protein, partial [Nocardioides sp.]|uniref:glycoside hydrolase family 15 protein n=1 Tax=Nocardioides sp. TaxID=35761 RepID=UPI003267B82E